MVLTRQARYNVESSVVLHRSVVTQRNMAVVDGERVVVGVVQHVLAIREAQRDGKRLVAAAVSSLIGAKGLNRSWEMSRGEDEMVLERHGQVTHNLSRGRKKRQPSGDDAASAIG